MPAASLMAPAEPGKARILRAALELAAESGPQGTTISEVCRRAAVTPPSVYYHFGSKEGLLGAVVESVSESWLQQLEALQPAGADLDIRLRAAIDGWQAMIEDPSRPLKLLLSVQLESAAASPEVRASLERVYERARGVIGDAIKAAVGDVPNLEIVSDVVLGLVQAAALGFHLDADRQRLHLRLLELGNVLRLLVLTQTPTRKG